MRVLFSIAIVILISSCGYKPPSPSNGFKSVISDSITFEKHQILAEVLNLSQINRGVDSFELRIWSSVASTDLEIVTILKFTDSLWHLTETRYWISRINKYPDADLPQLDSSETKKGRANSQFSVIIDSIQAFNLEAIPDQNKIPGFRDRTADGMYYTLEVATKNRYKIFSYHNPSRYQDSIHLKVTAILDYFKRNVNAFVLF